MDAISAGARPMRPAMGASVVDVAQMVEQIWRDLDGKVSREAIRQVVSDVAARYQDARIQTFVPIFVRRDALRELAGYMH